MKVFFCGDIVVSKRHNDIISTDLRKRLSSCNYSVCNLEAPIKQEKCLPIEKVGPHLSCAPNSIELLNDAGFNIFSLANNHIFDYSLTALNYTKLCINNNGCDFVGVSGNGRATYEPKVIRGEKKVAIFSAADCEFGCEKFNENGYAYINSSKLDKEILKIQCEVDYIILIAHAGVEKIDVPLPEWQKRYRELIDLGVNVIVGHHPHVPQGYENYNGGLIFYSLGNFFFDTAGYSENVSYSIILDISNDISFELIPHKVINGKVHVIDKINISELNSKIFDDTYIDKVCNDIFNERYLPYIKHSMLGLPETFGFYGFTKSIVKWLLKRNINRKHRELLFYHLFRVDSHRYLIERYYRGNYDV
ncbi:CapA family protein [Vibrio parahaemolyticus]|uniref:CapA family protein n=1 Tax=Vibrio parahaemolyticus TaxID=670 RepID=UPI00084B8B78|nr:CapA family protein [Vibrio parahaemolyticus]EGR3351578.1 CapA family protein [Vibrio parahaemolyticus]EJG1852834.1 CapA family protein [Vibrio parahaemolyticus]ODZ73527.1 hypothetical protein BBM46_17650 [Vibrio parahaemolyticus]OEA18843.1 hypothetical protein BBM54_01750 [Vibrio parahaemolyticus]HCG7290575.1 CapA family protein [Vibrio parahaemolyticus]